MKDVLTQIGIKDETFALLTVRELVRQKILERPIDGNHGELHPKGDDFVPDGVPFIMASDINSGHVDYSGCKFISPKQAEGLRKGFARNGDVLLTHKATMGRTAIVKYDEHPFIMLTPQVTYYRVANRERLDNLYLRYYFESDFFQRILHLWADSGSTRAYLGITEQEKLPIILPPLAKQRKIAAILSAYDDLIANNSQQVALLETMAEDIYREWFVRLRFPGHQKLRVVKGIPEGWAIEHLGSLVSDIIDYRGITPEKLGMQWALDGVTALSALNVKNGRLIKLEDTYKASDALYERWMRKKLETHDILLTSEAPLGQVYMLMDSARYVLSQRLFALRANKQRIAPCYLYHYLLGPIGQGQLAARATGSTVGGIRQQLLRQIDVVVPPEHLQAAYTRVALPILGQIRGLSEANTALRSTRDLLLPRLISGKLAIDHLPIRFPPGMAKDVKPELVDTFHA